MDNAAALAVNLKDKYVSDITDALVKHRRENYPETLNNRFDRENYISPYPKEEKMGKYVDPLANTYITNKGLNAQEAKANPQYEESYVPINLRVADGLNVLIDGIGDKLGQDWSHVSNRFQRRANLSR